jgi:hypothetical protein
MLKHTTPILHILVVTYKMEYEKSETINALIKYSSIFHGCVIHFWDNSPDQSYVSRDLLEPLLNSNRIEFYWTPENTPLSKIYNKIASQIDSTDYLTLLDQDTTLPAEFWTELLEQINFGHSLILPRIYCNSILVSPGKRFIAKGYLLSNINPGIAPSKNMLAINSGMTIRADVIKNTPYNEELKFYGTDTYFMRMYEASHKDLYILESTLTHSLAEMEERSNEWRESHLQEKIRTWKIIFKSTPGEIFFVRLYEFFLKLRKAL